MDLVQKLEAGVDSAVDWCNELQQRFGKVRGDVRVSQRRSQTDRVRRLRQVAIGGDAQTFLFDAPPDAGQ